MHLACGGYLNLEYTSFQKKVWVEEEKKVQETRMFKIKSSLLALDPARLGPDHYYRG